MEPRRPATMRLLLFPILALSRDLSPPPGPAPRPHPDYPEDPPPDPRCRSCRWGARVGKGNASLVGHLQPLGAHAKPTGQVEELPEMPDPATMYEKARLNVPFVVRGGIRAQPAFQSWSDEYMAKEFGESTVFVEIEKKEDRFGEDPKSWSLKKFIREIKTDNESFYVVQDLTPKMRHDWQLLRPLACREISMRKMMVWFSSGGTSSVPHTDAYENFLTLLSGSKTLLLFHQEEAPKLYAHAARKDGTSPIDVDAVDMELFPTVADVKYMEVTLQPGDVLYIPRSYWHQVRSERGKRNLAVNYWWLFPHDKEVYDDEENGEYIRGLRAKQRWPTRVKCTPLAEGATYDQVRFSEQKSGEEDQLGPKGWMREGTGEDDEEDDEEEEDEAEDEEEDEKEDRDEL